VADLDELNQSEDEEEDASGTPPVTTQQPDLEALVRKALQETLKPELDSRFSGLQSIQDKRLAQLAKDLRASSMTPAEQEEVLEQERSQETEKALRIAELIKRRKTAPEAVDFLLESMEKADLDEQVAFIQSVLKSSSQAVPAAPSKGDESDDENEIPQSNKNNPPSNRNPQLESGEDMNEELADAILDQVGKGQFSRFFGRGR
jgi:hypothetical protein